MREAGDLPAVHRDLDELFWLIEEVFHEKARTGKYAESWKAKFLPKKLRNRIAASRVS